MRRHIAPFGQDGQWFKGNIHAHTTQSDGTLSPNEAQELYRSLGYDFLAITDHWVHTPGTVTSEGLLTLTGVELHGVGYHMVALGIPSLPPHELAVNPETLAAYVRAQGGLAIGAHPYWLGQTSTQLREIPSLNGIEVFNSVCDVAVGLGYSNVQWDELLAEGKRPLAYAVDDLHRPTGVAGRGYVMVRAEELTEATMLRALADGNYYSSMGPEIRDMYVTMDETGIETLQAETSPCKTITFHCIGPRGKRFADESGGSLITQASLRLKSDMGYVRVACTDALGRTAWSNALDIT